MWFYNSNAVIFKIIINVNRTDSEIFVLGFVYSLFEIGIESQNLLTRKY